MRILFDHGTPRGIAPLLIGHTVVTAYSQGWDRLTNGQLLMAADKAGFDMLVTTDRRMRYQQNFEGRSIAIVVIAGATKWSQVRLHTQAICDAVNAAAGGSYAEVYIPFQ